MLRTYAWQATDWPKLRYDENEVRSLLSLAATKRGQLDGLLLAAGLEDRQRAEVIATTEEAVTTSEIEGEKLDPEATRSSVALQLGVDYGGARQADRKSKGVVEMLVDAAQHFDVSLTSERLFHWHRGLFEGSDASWVGRYRTAADGPERVIAGPYGNHRVLYEAPPGERVASEMEAFLAWFATPFLRDESPVVRSAIAHLWFVTIHPFVDGNGRIARAISDLTFARAEQSGHRYFSMSAQIREDRNEYEEALQSAQRGKSLDATLFVMWFASDYARALERSLVLVRVCMERTLFWARHRGFDFNPRQRKMLSRFLGDWEGKLTAGKWARSTDVSLDTALRDIDELVKGRILKREGAGRGTNYVLADATNV
jgi:Fic family protein